MGTEKDILGKGLTYDMEDGDESKYDLPKREDASSLEYRDFLKIIKTGKPYFDTYVESLSQEMQSLNPLRRKQTKSFNYKDKLAGCILGFAIGDSMGAPLEFSKNPGKIIDYLPSPRKGLKQGQFTDDTQHLILGLESLIEFNGDLNLQDQADRLIQWYTSGNARSIGRTTRKAIENLLSGIDYHHSGVDSINNCGSLAIPRLIPISLMSSMNRKDHKIQRADIRSILSITHAHRNVTNMGELFNYFIQEIMQGKSTEETLDMILFENQLLNKRIRNKLSKVRDLVESDKTPIIAIEEIGNSGFVEDVVFSSIYGVLKGDDFREAILISANNCGDTDSRAAFSGALFGLDIGESNIPSDLKDRLEKREELEKMAKQLFYFKK
ncbi:ADP-ribosylglycohydrolase family protein [Candidatus Woesearchaeota archaeon]|nr:ADP-ribosylglycohydrolase family protein [Candidatus Woesearchaeota archaeon]